MKIYIIGSSMTYRACDQNEDDKEGFGHYLSTHSNHYDVIFKGCPGYNTRDFIKNINDLMYISFFY